jgi:hypothetical protein
VTAEEPASHPPPRSNDPLSSSPLNAGRFAHVFHRVIPNQDACRKRLLDLLRTPECKRPDLVLDSLRKIASPADREVVDAVLGSGGIERPGVSWMERDHLVYTLIEGFHRDPRVREIAKDAFGFEYPPYTAIARAYADDAELRGLLRGRLSPLPDRLRLSIARHLAAECPDAAFTQELLSAYRREQDESVKCEASLAYYRHLAARGEVTVAHVEALANDIVCYGPDHERQRQAAFCGLATVGRLDIMASAQESIGEPRPCAVLREQFLGDDRPLERILAGRGGERVCNKTVVALSEGWPGHPYLDAAYKAIKEESPTLSYPTWQYLACARGTVEEAVAVLRFLCQTSSLEFRQQHW